MGINETSFSYGYGLGSGYLSSMARSYLDLSAVDYRFLLSARTCTNALNQWAMYAAAPNSYVRVFPGGKIYYNVTESSYSGSYSGASSGPGFNAQIKDMAAGSSVRIYASQIGGKLNLVKSLAPLLKNQYLSEDSKASVKAYIDDAKARGTKLDKLLQNEAGYSADQLNAILSAELEEIEAIVEETNEKVKEWQDEITEAEQAALDDALEDTDDIEQPSGVKRGSDAASGTAAGVKVDSLSEDEELDAAKSKSRYGMSNEASIPDAGDVSSLVASATAEDFTTKDKFTALFGKDKNINEKNIVEVLDAIDDKGAFVDKIAALKDGDNDYSEKAIKEMVKLLKARVQILDKAGHIEATDKNIVNAHISNLTSYASNVTANKTTIVSTLETIVNTLKGKGTESVVTAAIQAKQEEATTKAPKEFREDYAKANDKTYDETKTYVDFPEEITYLPNKKLFQVAIKCGTGADEKTFYFEAGNFAKLNKVITDNASLHDDLVTKWNTIKAKLLEEQVAAPEA